MQTQKSLEIIADYNSNMSLKNIMTKYNVTKATIYYQLDKFNVAIKKVKNEKIKIIIVDRDKQLLEKYKNKTNQNYA